MFPVNVFFVITSMHSFLEKRSSQIHFIAMKFDAEVEDTCHLLNNAKLMYYLSQVRRTWVAETVYVIYSSFSFKFIQSFHVFSSNSFKFFTYSAQIHSKFSSFPIKFIQILQFFIWIHFKFLSIPIKFIKSLHFSIWIQSKSLSFSIKLIQNF